MKKISLLFALLLFSTFPVTANSREEVSLVKCIDGDTVRFNIDGVDTKVRFLAIDTPEYTKQKEPYGKEASEFVCDILTNAENITIEYDEGSGKLDKYDRTLGWVFADEFLVQRELIKQGLAEVKYIYGEYAYTEDLQTLEKQAKKEKHNMWSNDAPDESDSAIYIGGTLGGICLILTGLFFTKGKRKQKAIIKKGIKKMQK